MNKLKTILHDDITQDYYLANPSVAKALKKIEDSVLPFFSTIDSGEVTFYFTTIGEICISARSKKYQSLAEKAAQNIDQKIILNLQKDLSLPEIGTWLSAVMHFNCKEQKFILSINRTRRFSTLESNWLYDPLSDYSSPTREEFIRHFTQYPRSEKYIPDWYEELIKEQEEIDYLLEVSNNSDIFEEALSTRVKLPANLKKLSSHALLKTMWEKISEEYSDSLLQNKDVVLYFIDDDKKQEQSLALRENIEIEILAKVLNFLQLNTDAEERAKLINEYFLLIKRDMCYPIYDNSGFQEDEIDYDYLDEDFSDFIYTLIHHQTHQRFPDLDSSYL